MASDVNIISTADAAGDNNVSIMKTHISLNSVFLSVLGNAIDHSVRLSFISFPTYSKTSAWLVFRCTNLAASECFLPILQIYTTRSIPCNSTVVLKSALVIGMNWLEIVVEHCSESCVDTFVVRRSGFEINIRKLRFTIYIGPLPQ